VTTGSTSFRDATTTEPQPRRKTGGSAWEKYGQCGLAVLGVLLGKKRLPHDFVARTAVLLRSDARATGATTWVDIDRDRPTARFAWTVLAAVAVFFALSSTTLSGTTCTFKVVGAAMEPTLHNDEYLLVSTVAYRMHAPQRDDVVAFWAAPAGQPERVFIQRIMGLPGETVEVASGAIYIKRTAFRSSPWEGRVDARGARSGGQ
jgi:signal peptidase I